MITIEKIRHHILPQVFDTINLLVNEGDIKRLESWLKDCETEIKRREEQKENTYPLYFELTYLRYVLNA